MDEQTKMALEKARDALYAAVERYDAMGWYDGEELDEEEREEARQAEEALEAVRRALGEAA